jgi:hypothetical protein
MLTRVKPEPVSPPPELASPAPVGVEPEPVSPPGVVAVRESASRLSTVVNPESVSLVLAAWPQAATSAPG